MLTRAAGIVAFAAGVIVGVLASVTFAGHGVWLAGVAAGAIAAVLVLLWGTLPRDRRHVP